MTVVLILAGAALLSAIAKGVQKGLGTPEERAARVAAREAAKARRTQAPSARQRADRVQELRATGMSRSEAFAQEKRERESA